MVVDGGMTVNNTLMQIQADLMHVVIIRKKEKEITSIGAAIAAGLQVKFWESLKDVESKIELDRMFMPSITIDKRDEKLQRWSEAV